MTNHPDLGTSLREKYRGLFGTQPTIPLTDPHMLSVIYTPGIATPCLEIQKDHLISFDYTIRGNTIAVVSDGSSVYGLGNTGPEAAIPMLESLCTLHKNFAGTDAVPVALKVRTTEEIIETIRLLAPTFGGFHLSGFSAPKCYEIEDILRRAVSVPVMHGDHGLAVVAVAGLLNALKVVNKRLQDSRIVIFGAGPSGISTARLLLAMHAGDVKLCDEYGLVEYHRVKGMDWVKSEIARKTNAEGRTGTLEEALVGADVFIGYKDDSRLDPQIIAKMAPKPILFALALPNPEMDYDEARAAGAAVVATRSNTAPNAINASMGYTGIFRGALEVRATEINEAMKIAATISLAGMVNDDDVTAENILPSYLQAEVAATVARSVAQAAVESGVAQVFKSPQAVERKVHMFRMNGTSAWVKPEQGNWEHMSTAEKSMEIRRRHGGAVETIAKVPISDNQSFNAVYSPVNTVKTCQEIREHKERVYDLTSKNNLVAVITDGSAVLGLGNIGPGAGLPVMEGKSVLFKTFGGVDAFPICLRTQEVEAIIDAVKALTPVLGGINLEDISAPRCFEIEERLIEETDIPIFHDDQHGTAVVAVAGILNAVKAVGKELGNVRVAVNGAGASALSVSKLLMKAGIQDITICDTRGIIYLGRPYGMNAFKDRIAEVTNKQGMQGELEDAVRGADIFIGLSVAGALSQDMVRSMAKDPIILAMANPTPEIMPDEAFAAGAKIMGTGRSDFPNQVNNCLAFPGIFRGTLDVRASRINDEMKLAAARAIAADITEEELEQGIIIPSTFKLEIPPRVAAAVAQAAIDTGVARRPIPPDIIAKALEVYLRTGELHYPQGMVV
jgi:malate dehydrogenase (oxaloacetate-decarboxylating)